MSRAAKMKIAIITGSRADRGPLEMVHQALRKNHEVFGIDVSPDDPKINTRHDAAESAGVALKVVSNYGLDDGLDLVILLGDRYEILGAAVAANIMGIPIAHLSGGDVTEGSQDDCFRHAITKLSHLHFATCEESARRIIQMGEEPERVHVVGCPGVDRIMQTKLMGAYETRFAIGLGRIKNFVVVCLHPNTLGDTADDIHELQQCLNGYDKHGVVLIGPNADFGCEILRGVFQKFAMNRPHTVYRDSVDGPLYLSLLKHADAFIGNSSAIYYECPTLGTPVIGIGDRQKGREPHYGDGRVAERIAAIISAIDNPKALLRKRFHEGSNAWPLTPSGRESTETESGGDIQKRS